MSSSDYQNRLLAVAEIFNQDLPVRRKLDALKTGIRNINPVLDEKLDHCCHAWDHLNKLREGKITEVVVESMPEGSEEEKKRKQKARQLLRFYKNLESGNFRDITADLLPEETEEEKERKRKFLLFVQFWRDLESEVARLRSEINQLSQAKNNPTNQVGVVSRIVGLAKGPFGLITLLAFGVVLFSNFFNSVSREVVVINQGCATIYPQTQMDINLPGFRLPKEAIPNGGRSTIVLPPLDLAVDYTNSQKGKISGYGLSFTIEALGVGVEPILNGQNLLGKITRVRLSERETHELVLRCRAKKV